MSSLPLFFLADQDGLVAPPPYAVADYFQTTQFLVPMMFIEVSQPTFPKGSLATLDVGKGLEIKP